MPRNVTLRSRLLRRSAVLERVALSGETIDRLIRDHEFPPAIALSPNTVGWKESDIDAWLESRVQRAIRRAARRAGGGE